MIEGRPSNQALPRIIYVTGIDGSGKSTVSEHLAERLCQQGYKVDVLWLRFNHVLSKPILGLCRVLGLTRYEMCDGIRVGYHDFYRSRIISWLFVFFQYLDAVRVRFLKVGPRIRGGQGVLIVDRYIYDILIDVMVDTRMSGLHKGWVGRAFRKLLPSNTLSVLVDRDLDKVLDVRPEGKVDRNFQARYQYYKELSGDDDVVTVENNGPLEALLDKVEECAGLKYEA